MKLVAYGVEGRELGWFKSYLSNRIQQVNFKQTLSDEQQVTIGVPQWSILGPMLFIIFMNDALDAIKQILDLYADDTTLQTSDLESLKGHPNMSTCSWVYKQYTFSDPLPPPFQVYRPTFLAKHLLCYNKN